MECLNSTAASIGNGFSSCFNCIGDTAKSGWTVLSDFGTNTVVPAFHKVCDFFAKHWNALVAWVKANPTTVRDISIGAVGAAIVTALGFFACNKCCKTKESEGDDKESRKSSHSHRKHHAHRKPASDSESTASSKTKSSSEAEA